LGHFFNSSLTHYYLFFWVGPIIPSYLIHRVLPRCWAKNWVLGYGKLGLTTVVRLISLIAFQHFWGNPKFQKPGS